MPSGRRVGNVDGVSLFGQCSTSVREPIEVWTAAALGWFCGLLRDPGGTFVGMLLGMHILQVGVKRTLQ
jgi:hypothetical protein